MTITILSDTIDADKLVELTKHIQKISHIDNFKIRIQANNMTPHSIIINKKEKGSKSVCASTSHKSKKYNQPNLLNLTHIERSLVKNPKTIYHIRGKDLQVLIDSHLKIQKIIKIKESNMS